VSRRCSLLPAERSKREWRLTFMLHGVWRAKHDPADAVLPGHNKKKSTQISYSYEASIQTVHNDVIKSELSLLPHHPPPRVPSLFCCKWIDFRKHICPSTDTLWHYYFVKMTPYRIITN
jgi:hypothetical protein